MRFKEGIREKNIIVRCGADKILPFALMFGVYIILFGTISPGGGFQGGVMVASAALLLYLGYDYKTASEAERMEFLRVGESLGAVIYVLLGFAGIFAGAVFARNIFFNNGQIGDMISAGNVTFMGYAVGFKVLTGISFLILLMLGLVVPDMKADKGELLVDEEELEELAEEAALAAKAAGNTAELPIEANLQAASEEKEGEV